MKLPGNISDSVRRRIYERADQYGYAFCDRVESGRFMDHLVDDPDIGGVLGEFFPKERIRTYIKDGVLNAYMKNARAHILSQMNPIDTIKRLYSADAEILESRNGSYTCCSHSGDIYIITTGTYVKWETALRKALDLIASNPKVTQHGKTPYICLHIANLDNSITEGDKKHLFAALQAINVKARIYPD